MRYNIILLRTMYASTGIIHFLVIIQGRNVFVSIMRTLVLMRGEPIDSRRWEGAGRRKEVGAGRDRRLRRRGCLAMARKSVHLRHHIDDALVRRNLVCCGSHTHRQIDGKCCMPGGELPTIVAGFHQEHLSRVDLWAYLRPD